MYKKESLFIRAAGAALFAVCSTAALAQTDELKWTQNSFKDGQTGRTVATLTYGIPETDAVQLTASCQSGPTGVKSEVNLATDVGNLKDGARVKVRFSGGGQEFELKGLVSGTTAEVGIAGARVQIALDNPVWQALRTLQQVSYQVPGYAGSTLRLSGASQSINAYLQNCQNLGSGNQTASQPPSTPPASSGGISEKEAFDAAKDLGSIEAWQAFLSAFPTGFRADLARAYVQKLGGSTQPAAPASPPPQPPAQPAQPTLQTVDLGPGTAKWRNVYYEQDEGNARTYAASVTANGVEFLALCTPRKQVVGILREAGRGIYPDFDGRIQQALKANGAAGEQGALTLPMRFNTGRQYLVTGQYFGLNGEIGIGLSRDRGFSPNSSQVLDMMASNTMTLSAPPFSATFQLSGSRRIMCNMLRRCGARSTGCRRFEARPVTKPRQPRKPRGRCRRGQVFLEGQCINRRDVASFCGPGFRRRGSKCVSNAQQPQIPTCPPGLTWEVNSCVEDD